MENKFKDIYINLEGATETVALLSLVAIAMTAMLTLGLGGKEIALAIGSSIGGYLAKSAVETVKDSFKKDPDKKE